MVVVDARPALEGREVLRRLLRAGVSATYVHINSLAYVIPEVTQVHPPPPPPPGPHPMRASQLSYQAHTARTPIAARRRNAVVDVRCGAQGGRGG